jgi:ribonuclease E
VPVAIVEAAPVVEAAPLVEAIAVIEDAAPVTAAAAERRLPPWKRRQCPPKPPCRCRSRPVAAPAPAPVTAPAPGRAAGLNAVLGSAGLTLAATDPEKLRLAQEAAAKLSPRSQAARTQAIAAAIGRAVDPGQHAAPISAPGSPSRP